MWIQRYVRKSPKVRVQLVQPVHNTVHVVVSSKYHFRQDWNDIGNILFSLATPISTLVTLSLYILQNIIFR